MLLCILYCKQILLALKIHTLTWSTGSPTSATVTSTGLNSF